MEASLNQEKMRNEIKKVWEYFLDKTFNTILKSQAQWEKFVEELETILSLIIWVKDVPLTYDIWTIETDIFRATLPHE